MSKAFKIKNNWSWFQFSIKPNKLLLKIFTYRQKASPVTWPRYSFVTGHGRTYDSPALFHYIRRQNLKRRVVYHATSKICKTWNTCPEKNYQYQSVHHKVYFHSNIQIKVRNQVLTFCQVIKKPFTVLRIILFQSLVNFVNGFQINRR